MRKMGHMEIKNNHLKYTVSDKARIKLKSFDLQTWILSHLIKFVRIWIGIL